MGLAVRALIAVVLVMIAVPFAWFGYGVLSNLWIEDGGDSRAQDYLMIGLPLAGLSLACLVGAVLILRRRS